MKSVRVLTLLACVLPASALAMLQFPGNQWLADYAAATPTDVISRLQAGIDRGDVKLVFDEEHGYLSSVLKELRIPASSQSLVFSKTSFQLDKIAPWTPRAIYFNDDVYIGWVQRGRVIEVAAVDPKLGAVFYTLEQKAEEKPRFQREFNNCLQCHDAMLNTGGVPGFVVQSVYSDRYGYPLPSDINPVSSDRTPLRNRFGGWYVTGTHGDQLHMGNFNAAEAAHEIGNVKIYLDRLNLTATGNVTDLKKRFNTEPYLSPHSDIVAMMLLVHQTYLHNLMTLASTDTRAKDPQRAEALVKGMLFVREARLSGPIKGSTSFAAEFSSAGPRDHKGRSLRELDLNGRLLKYPLSYLIYSEGFNGLPFSVKTYVYRRLREVLTGQDDSPEFAHLSQTDRNAILEILRDTKPDFAETEILPNR